MNKPLYKSKGFWSVLFLTVFILTQSAIIIDYDSDPLLLGFPLWLWVFMALHLFFGLALYGFIKHSDD